MSNKGTREDIRAYNQTLVAAYWGDASQGVPGESAASIAQRSGRSISTIHKLIAADVAQNGERTRIEPQIDSRKLSEKRVISPRHGWIGMCIAVYRAEHELTPSAFGALLPATRSVVRNMELGAHDFTLTEVENLSKILDADFITLVQGKASVHQMPPKTNRS